MRGFTAVVVISLAATGVSAQQAQSPPDAAASSKAMKYGGTPARRPLDL